MSPHCSRAVAEAMIKKAQGLPVLGKQKRMLEGKIPELRPKGRTGVTSGQVRANGAARGIQPPRICPQQPPLTWPFLLTAR